MPLTSAALSGQLSAASVTGKLGGASMGGTLSIVAAAPPYVGPTEYTPTDTAQVVQVAGHTCGTNITINPIPSNYGRVTWDGSTLTVS